MRSLTFTAAPLIGAFDGLNERGLCITYNYAYATDTAPPAPPLSAAIANALDNCSTVAEAADWITRQPRWGAGLLMLADAGGDIAALDRSNSRAALRRPAEGEDLLFHSNAYQTPRLQEVEVAKAAVWDRAVPRALPGQDALESSRQRDLRFRELCGAAGSFGSDELTELMSDHGLRDEPGANTICMQSNYWHTTAALQFYPATCQIRVAYEPTCSCRFEEFAL